MSAALVSFVAFMAVMLLALLVYGAWVSFFDPRNKAKKERLQAIGNTVQRGGQGVGIAQAALPDSELESWLRANSRSFGRLEGLVRHAHSPLTAGQLVALMAALFLVVVLLGLLFAINALLLLAMGGALGGLPLLWLNRTANKRREAFESKLPDALDYISRALRTGHSLASAISMVGKEFADPIGYEFKTVADEMTFGIGFKEAIGRLAERVQSNDLSFFVIAVVIQHETGGSLTELFDGLAKTIRDRFKLRGKIRTLSSEGRASAWILSALPFVLAAIISVISPDFISVLWTTPKGRQLALTGLGLMLVGFFVLNRIIKIKV